MDKCLEILDKASIAKSKLLTSTQEQRYKALKAISEALIENEEEILKANKLDIEANENISDVMKKRLLLTSEKLKSIANDCLEVNNLSEVLNEELEEIIRPNGLCIKKVRVPFGIILTIFESRPNVCVDIASLCIKTGNVCILRGGKEALNTNKALVNIMKKAISPYITQDSINLIENIDKNIVSNLITMKDKIDLVVPRGGKGLIDYIVNNSVVPVIETGAGVCHLYVDSEASLDMAYDVLLNAKMSNPAVCNSCECLLVHRDVASSFLNILVKNEFDKKVKLFGCNITKGIIDCDLVESYNNEFNDLILNIKVVDDLEEAINHINTYGTKHSETIITNNRNNYERFMDEVDAACVYLNSSTRFSDGGCFGFGAELGISTGKMHARGPMGLKEMMTYKYKIYGNGQIRK